MAQNSEAKVKVKYERNGVGSVQKMDKNRDNISDKEPVKEAIIVSRVFRSFKKPILLGFFLGLTLVLGVVLVNQAVGKSPLNSKPDPSLMISQEHASNSQKDLNPFVNLKHALEKSSVTDPACCSMDSFRQPGLPTQRQVQGLSPKKSLIGWVF